MMAQEPRDPAPVAPGIGDGLRRALLASERTYLSWWRTSLALLAVSIAIGRLLPQVIGSRSIAPYVVVGAGWALLAVAVGAYGQARLASLRSSIEGGGYAHPHRWATGALGVMGLVLTVASAVLVVIAP